MASYNTTVISANAFKNNTLLKTVVAKSILSVEDSAFEQCQNLYDVQLDQCTDIQNYTFSNCTSLNSIKADNVKTIGNFAFDQTVNLSSYDFPNCLSIGNGAFRISNVYPQKISKKNKSTYNFPECRYIGDSAFSIRILGDNNNVNAFVDMSSFNFPKCERIGQYAFYTENRDSDSILYPNILDINFNKCVEIGDSAFRVGINDNVSYNTWFFTISSLIFPECERIGNYAFYINGSENKSREPKLKEIRFPKCKEIGDYAFHIKRNDDNRYTNNVSSIQFDKCEKIGGYAFNNFKTNNKLDLNLSSCLSIEEYSFDKTNFISSLNLENCKQIRNYCFNDATLYIKDLDLPNIQNIGDWNMQNLTCSNLTSISFGQNLSSFGTNNFYNISNRNITLTINENNPYFEIDKDSNIIYSKAEKDPNGRGLIEAKLIKGNVIENDMDYVRQYAAYYNSNITLFKSPTCKRIESRAFYNCTNISSIIASNVSSIGDYAFYNDTKLVGALEFNECLSIGNYAFGHDNVSKSIEINSISLPKCKYIGHNCFNRNGANTDYDDYNVGSIYIPSCLSIGQYAFKAISITNCQFFLGETVPTLIKTNGTIDNNSNIGKYIKYTSKIMVPIGRIDAYKAAWGNNYWYGEYDPSESEKPQYNGYLYKGNEPVEGDATILKMSLIKSLTEEHAEIPDIITEEN